MNELRLERTLVKEMPAVVVHPAEAESTHPLAQATFDHRTLCRRQLDTDIALDHLGQLAEMAIAQPVQR